MSGATITFPLLGDGFSFNPARYFTVGSFRIYWYGVLIALGFLLAAFYAIRHSKEYGLTMDHILDVIIIGVPSAIVGARLYYVAHNFSLFQADSVGQTLLNIVDIKNGGSAIYGGLLLAVLMIWIYSHAKKIPLFTILDVAAPSLFIGQCVGRWGNFINREVYGTETDFFLRMGLTTSSGTIYVHPIFLYESVWDLLGFIFLHNFSKKRKFDGQMFAIYMIWYGVGRLVCESLRNPAESMYIGNTGIKASFAFAAVSIVAALAFLFLYGPKHLSSGLYRDRAAAEAAEAAKAAEETETGAASGEPDADDEKYVVLEEGVDENGNKFQYVEVEVDEDEQKFADGDAADTQSQPTGGSGDAQPDQNQNKQEDSDSDKL